MPPPLLHVAKTLLIAILAIALAFVLGIATERVLHGIVQSERDLLERSAVVTLIALLSCGYISGRWIAPKSLVHPAVAGALVGFLGASAVAESEESLTLWILGTLGTSAIMTIGAAATRLTKRPTRSTPTP